MIYICGDSFGTSDSSSEVTPWHKNIYCTNLSKLCATNLQISQQVDYAIDHASFIIVLFTTCVRFEFGNDSYTLHNLSSSNLNTEEQKIVTDYAKHFFNLDLEIYRNKCIIESVLQRLVDSGIPFLFDQGGFEHKKWGTTKTYFTKYNDYRSKYNLWDYGDSKLHRPYFHITDQKIHNEIAEYYNDQTR
jgi:hypothetical protein